METFFCASLNYHSKGICKKLSQRAIDLARELKKEYLDLEVLSLNKKAIALYESLGFEIVGETIDEVRLDGHALDGLKMTLKL